MSVASGIMGRFKRSTEARDTFSSRSLNRIKVRTVEFDFSNTPLHWVPNDIQTSHMINVLHLLLPEGERWFCRAFHGVLPEVTDQNLRMQMRGFMGQEAIHANAHEELYQFLKDNDVDPDDYLKYIRWLFQHALSDTPFNFPMSESAEREWNHFRVAVVAAIEHFTGLLGSWLLRATPLDDAGADEEMMDLLRWHAAEEVEHQAVAHDLFRHVNGKESYRWIAMGLTLPLLTGFWIWGTSYMQKRDPIAPSKPTWANYFRAAKAGRLPSLTDIYSSVVPNFFTRRYYPGRDDQEAVAMAEEYLKYAPGVTNHAPQSSLS